MIVRLLLALLGALALAAPGAAAPQRTMAVTFDDLPITGSAGTPCRPERLLAFNSAFVTMLRAERIPAAVLANAGRACSGDRTFMAEVLRSWVDAGFELGNHTATHPDLNRVGVDAFMADVEAGEPPLIAALAPSGRRLRYFRHPFLRTGATEEIRSEAARRIAERGYTVAPVTIDNEEWVFAAVYADAEAKGDAAVKARIGAAYVDYMLKVTEFYEGYSREMLGREPAQVLLLHVNALNRDHFPALRHGLAARGYRFVSLDQALQDPVYRTPDTYLGRRGISWLQRWAVARGGRYTPEPATPEWVTALHRSLD